MDNELCPRHCPNLSATYIVWIDTDGTPQINNLFYIETGGISLNSPTSEMISFREGHAPGGKSPSSGMSG